MISLPDKLLVAVDNAAARASLSRSAFIREALHARLAAGHAPNRAAALAELRRRLGRGDWKAEDLVRAERER